MSWKSCLPLNAISAAVKCSPRSWILTDIFNQDQIDDSTNIMETLPIFIISRWSLHANDCNMNSQLYYGHTYKHIVMGGTPRVGVCEYCIIDL